jgi:preprotein translocase subunit SecG
MMILLTIVQVIVCLFLILVVLLQQGKSADWSGTFGGGSSQTAFGQRGTATLLSKATTAAAIIFMVNSLALTIVSTRQGSRSVVPAVAPAATPAPAAETPKAAEPTPAPAGEAAPGANKETTPPAPATPPPAKEAPPTPPEKAKQK